MSNPTTAQLLAQIEALKQENAQLTRAKPSGSIKVSAKGAVSIYGMGRFPVTLYASQWQQLFDKQEEIKNFIVANAQVLADKTKTETQATPEAKG